MHESLTRRHVRARGPGSRARPVALSAAALCLVTSVGLTAPVWAMAHQTGSGGGSNSPTLSAVVNGTPTYSGYKTKKQTCTSSGGHRYSNGNAASHCTTVTTHHETATVQATVTATAWASGSATASSTQYANASDTVTNIQSPPETRSTTTSHRMVATVTVTTSTSVSAHATYEGYTGWATATASGTAKHTSRRYGSATATETGTGSGTATVTGVSGTATGVSGTATNISGTGTVHNTQSGHGTSTSLSTAKQTAKTHADNNADGSIKTNKAIQRATTNAQTNAQSMAQSNAQTNAQADAQAAAQSNANAEAASQANTKATGNAARNGVIAARKAAAKQAIANGKQRAHKAAKTAAKLAAQANAYTNAQTKAKAHALALAQDMALNAKAQKAKATAHAAVKTLDNIVAALAAAAKTGPGTYSEQGLARAKELSDYTPSQLVTNTQKLLATAKLFLNHANVNAFHAAHFAAQRNALYPEIKFSLTEQTILAHTKRLTSNLAGLSKLAASELKTYTQDVTAAKAARTRADTQAANAKAILTKAQAHPAKAKGLQPGLKTAVAAAQKAAGQVGSLKSQQVTQLLQLNGTWSRANQQLLQAKKRQLDATNHNLADLELECGAVRQAGGPPSTGGTLAVALTPEDFIAACADGLPAVPMPPNPSLPSEWASVIRAQLDAHATRLLLMGGLNGGNGVSTVTTLADYLARRADRAFTSTETIGIVAGNSVYDSAAGAKAYANTGSLGSAVAAMQFNADGNQNGNLPRPPSYRYADGPYPYVLQGPRASAGGEAMALQWGTPTTHLGPQLLQLTPNAGPAGTAITVVGSRFGSQTGVVRFREGTATWRGTVTQWTPTDILVTVPGSLAPGTAAVSVVNGSTHQSSQSLAFTVTSAYSQVAPAPRITGLAPAGGPDGSTVTLTGMHFGRTAGLVQFAEGGATPDAAIQAWSSTQIVVTVPAGLPAGNAQVTVTNPSTQESSNPAAFTVDPLAPVLSGLAPSSGPPNTAVTLLGSAFGSRTGLVRFTQHGVAHRAPIDQWSAGAITVLVPGTLAPGAAQVTVATNAGAASNAATFTVTAPSVPAPALSTIQPTQGLPGTTVTLTGSAFGSGTGQVWFTQGGRSRSASVQHWTSTQIVATVPAALNPGAADVTVATATQRSNAVAFTVTQAAVPTLTAITPAKGPVGTTLTLTGASFGAATGAVRFASAHSVYVVTPAAWSNTSAQAVVPAALNPGLVQVAVINASGAQSGSRPFTVTAAPPTLTAITPTQGTDGASVTLTGAGFGNTGTVSFTEGAHAFTAPVTQWSASQITAAVPATIPAGTAQVAVTPVGNQATASKAFTVLPTPPVIGSIAPTSGPVGSTAGLSGAHFGATPGTVQFQETVKVPTQETQTYTKTVTQTHQETRYRTVTQYHTVTVQVPSTATRTVTVLKSTLKTVKVPISQADWTPSSALVTVPTALQPGVAQVLLITARGLASNVVRYTIATRAPTSGPVLYAVLPAQDPVGSTVTLLGSDLQTAGSRVVFTQQGIVNPATITQWGKHRMTVIVPQTLAPGSASITERTAQGSSNALAFTVTAAGGGSGGGSAPPAHGGSGVTRVIPLTTDNFSGPALAAQWKIGHSVLPGHSGGHAARTGPAETNPAQTGPGSRLHCSVKPDHGDASARSACQTRPDPGRHVKSTHSNGFATAVETFLADGWHFCGIFLHAASGALQ